MAEEDFGYINARIRGMRSRLLGKEFYAEAMAGTDFRAFVTSLQQSTYGREVDEAQARYSGLRVVDEALARNFYRTTQSILNFSEGDPGRLIELILLRYDLHNIKAIARAKHAGRDADEIRQALFPAGRLKPAVLESISNADSVTAAAQASVVTGHPLSGAFLKAARAYTESGDLYALELALDRAYFAVTLETLEEVDHPEGFREHVTREIDATNLRTALKLRGQADVDAASLYIPGGRVVNQKLFTSIVNDASPAALEPLANTMYSGVAKATTLSEAEEAIRATLDRSARRLYLSDPLDIGVVLNYLREKEAETARLRLLARGKFYGVPRGQLERELGNA